MSNENENLDEVENKVTISGDDCGNVNKYCGHFGVDSTPELEDALEKFSNDINFENQLDVKLEICKWILSCDHESFKDSLWDAPKKAAEKVVYDLQFERDLKDTLGAVDEEDSE